MENYEKVAGLHMEKKLLQLLQDVLELEEAPDRTADPIEDLGMDSVDIVDYVLRIEEEFGCNIDEFDTLSQHMKSVGEMISYLVQFLESGEGPAEVAMPRNAT